MDRPPFQERALEKRPDRRIRHLKYSYRYGKARIIGDAGFALSDHLVSLSQSASEVLGHEQEQIVIIDAGSVLFQLLSLVPDSASIEIIASFHIHPLRRSIA